MAVRDAVGTLRSAPDRWRWTLEGLEGLPDGVGFALTELSTRLVAAGGHGSTIDELVEPVAAELERRGRGRPGRTLGQVLDPADPLLGAVDAVERQLSAAARLVVAVLGGPDDGVVDSLNVSDGGVPKLPVAAIEVRSGGCVGDTQRVRRHHGRPSQAVSLWSSEVVEALEAEGHPIRPGAAGENLTVRGVDWAAMRPGVRLVVGGTSPFVVEVTGWATPCSTIAGCFLDGRFRRIDHAGHPGWSRAYAAVVQPGSAATGDPVVVLP